jgi:hypothetical protein
LKGLDITALSASADGTTAGYTLLVSNSGTGEVERLLATSLISAGVAEFALSGTVPTGDYTTVAITGLPTEITRISVFKNGIKLRQLATGTPDWAFGTTAGTIKFTAANVGDFYAGDVIEVQWVN